MAQLFDICLDACSKRLDAAEVQTIANKLCKLTPVPSNTKKCLNQLPFVSKESRSVFRKFMLHLYESAKIPQQINEVERSLEARDFKTSELYLIEVFKLLTIFQIYFSRAECLLNENDKPIFTVVTIILIYEHMDSEKPWSSCAVNNAVQMLLAKILQLHAQESIKQLLKNCLGGRRILLASITDRLKPYLLKENWKKNPASLNCFVLLLYEMTSPEVGDCLYEIFPPILNLIDDFEPKHKVVGIHCINHVVDNTSQSELCLYGRAHVLHSALMHNMHSSDEHVMAELLPCLLRIAQILDINSPRKQTPLFSSKLDDVFQVLLTNMDFESKLSNRTLYAKYVSSFIEALGINVVKHMQRTVKIIESYLEIADYPHDLTRLYTITAMCSLIKAAWPRIPHYVCRIMQCLLKLCIDLNDQQGTEADENCVKLVAGVKDAFVLLSHVDKVQTIKMLKAASDIETLPTETKQLLGDIDILIRSVATGQEKSANKFEAGKSQQNAQNNKI